MQNVNRKSHKLCPLYKTAENLESASSHLRYIPTDKTCICVCVEVLRPSQPSHVERGQFT